MYSFLTILAFFSTHILTSVTASIFFAWLLWKLFSRDKVGDYNRKYVFITGCDSGFGKETAIRLDQMGFYVLATCLTSEGEVSLRRLCSDRVKTFLLNVTRDEEVASVYKKVQQLLPEGSGLWGLVNNAGTFNWGPIEWQPLDNFKRIADVNLWGLINVTKTFLPLVKRARGRIINFSSIAGRISIPFVSAYHITKYGVQAFSDALRREMAPWGIQVIIMEPGIFRTGLANPHIYVSQCEKLWADLDEDTKREYGAECRHKFIQFWKEIDERSNPKVYKVVDAVVDALTSYSPRTRYTVGLDAKILALISWLPTCIADWLLAIPIPMIYRIKLPFHM